MTAIAHNTSLTQLVADNALPHEALPLHVPPNYGWYKGASRGLWNDIPAGWSAMTAWGQVMFDQAAPQADASFSLRNFEHWVLANGVWVKVQGPDIGGAMFQPDYIGDIHTAPLAKSEANGVTTLRIAYGKCYQFYAANKTPIPAGTQAAIMLYEAKAIDSDYLITGGGDDWWKSMTAVYPDNRCLGVGRMRRMSRNWETFGFTTATVDQLRSFRQ